MRKFWLTALVAALVLAVAAPSFALEKKGMIGFGLSGQVFKWLMWGGDNLADSEFVGSSGDPFTVGGIVRLNVEYGLMDKLTLGLSAGYGRTYFASIDTSEYPEAEAGFSFSTSKGEADEALPWGYMQFIPIQLYGKYSFMTEGSVSPYVQLGAGIYMFTLKGLDSTGTTATLQYADVDGNLQDWSGIDLTPFLGLGVEFWAMENFAVQFGVSGHFNTWIGNSVATDFNDLTDNTDFGAPRLLAGVDLGLMYYFGKKDADNDRVADKLDQCPDTPKGAVVDEYGCPIDSDGDGVYDGLDTCPDTPYGAIVDPAGCPMDSDGDGVFDGIDNCADTPSGVKVDQYGCPLDTDKDGVPDFKDNCPNTPKGAVVDNAGCPLDTDKDGVYDGIDKCPGTVPGAKVDATGCEVAPAVSAITVQVKFRSGAADLDPAETTKLQEALQIMKDAPTSRWEIGGHTDSVGSARRNKELSQRRADSVRAWFTTQGIAADRLVAVGYGEDMPVGDNKTAAGRATNRRIEFKLIK